MTWLAAFDHLRISTVNSLDERLEAKLNEAKYSDWKRNSLRVKGIDDAENHAFRLYSKSESPKGGLGIRTKTRAHHKTAAAKSYMESQS